MTKTTKTYKITNSATGHSFGRYQATSPKRAIRAMLREAGHSGPADPDLVAQEVEQVRLEVYGEWGGSFGGWRPAVTGLLNQTGLSDAEASTFDYEAEAKTFFDEFIEIDLDAADSNPRCRFRLSTDDWTFDL